MRVTQTWKACSDLGHPDPPGLGGRAHNLGCYGGATQKFTGNPYELFAGNPYDLVRTGLTKIREAGTAVPAPHQPGR